MVAGRRKGKQTAVAKSKALASKISDKFRDRSTKELAEAHLPPLFLVLTVLCCSGAFLVFALRDYLSTGRNIGGPWDESFLQFTKSTDWYNNAKGWKSTQGGFSAVQSVTTDANNMGGFFVRKGAGAAAIAVHVQKLLPLVIHPVGAQWIMGHFRPLLWTALIGNLAIIAFLASYMPDLQVAEASELPRAAIGVLAFESVVFFGYLLASRTTIRGPAVALKTGKTPASVPSRIVSRTIYVVSTAIAMIAGRDLFFSGQIIDFLPRDDIYLEWTNAFLHSPPEGSPEEADQGLEAPLYIGDKFISQFMALHILILCLYKFVTAFFVRYGSDGSGEIKCKMIWQSQAIGDGLMLFLFRIFAPAAKSASLDLRWHLMTLAYETFVLGLFAFF